MPAAARVIERGTTSGGGSGSGSDLDEAVERPDEQRGVDRRRRWRGRGAGQAGGERRGGLPPEQPDAVERARLERGAGIAEGAVQEQPRAQLGLGVDALVVERERGPTGGRGSIARLLIRISWLATATNELMLLMRSCSIVASASRYASATAPRGTVRTSNRRASMSDSRSPSGPSHSAIARWVAQSRPRPGSMRTTG